MTTKIKASLHKIAMDARKKKAEEEERKLREYLEKTSTELSEKYLRVCKERAEKGELSLTARLGEDLFRSIRFQQLLREKLGDLEVVFKEEEDEDTYWVELSWHNG